MPLLRIGYIVVNESPDRLTWYPRSYKVLDLMSMPFYKKVIRQ
jgi:hypothetical protein